MILPVMGDPAMGDRHTYITLTLPVSPDAEIRFDSRVGVQKQAQHLASRILLEHGVWKKRVNPGLPGGDSRVVR